MKKIIYNFVLTLLLGLSLIFNYILTLTVIDQDRHIINLEKAAKADSILIDNYYKMLIEDVADQGK